MNLLKCRDRKKNFSKIYILKLYYIYIYIYIKKVSWAQIWALSYVLSQPFIMQCVSFWLHLGVYCTVCVVVVMLNKIESYSSPHPIENSLRCESTCESTYIIWLCYLVYAQSVWVDLYWQGFITNRGSLFYFF